MEIMTLAQRVDAIERGYEYLLAFAAQGRKDDVGSEARATLAAMQAALVGLSDVIAVALGARTNAAIFMATLADDARKAGGAIDLVLGSPAISSLLIDNLNASIHVRALLTDLFLTDQALAIGCTSTAPAIESARPA